MRVNDLAMSQDGHYLVALLESRILVYDFILREKLREIDMGDVKLTSINISSDSRCLLASMNDNMIQMLSIETGAAMQQFKGHKQTKFIIRSAFGGANETHVASGSEGEKMPFQLEQL